jgi:hypothetical protein
MRLTALFRPALTAAALAFLCASAPAQPHTERAYDPPVDSRWSIVTVSDSEDNRGAREKRDQHIRTRAELTIKEKLADGFRRLQRGEGHRGACLHRQDRQAGRGRESR